MWLGWCLNQEQVMNLKGMSTIQSQNSIQPSAHANFRLSFAPTVAEQVPLFISGVIQTFIALYFLKHLENALIFIIPLSFRMKCPPLPCPLSHQAGSQCIFCWIINFKSALWFPAGLSPLSHAAKVKVWVSGGWGSEDGYSETHKDPVLLYAFPSDWLSEDQKWCNLKSKGISKSPDRNEMSCSDGVI